MFKKMLNNEKGMALPVVLGLFMVMIVLAGGALFMGVSQTKMNAQYSNSMDAIHYAEAGINEYLWSLNKKDTGGANQNTDVAYGDGYYRYRLLEENEGYVKIRSTGWVKDKSESKRTIESTLTKRTFSNYVYLSDNDGDDIIFATGDIIYGPYHTNGTLRIGNNEHPVFFGKATYMMGIVNAKDGIFKKGYEQVQPLIFPTSNTQLMDWSKQAEGHYYDGRTLILLNADGTYYVRNKNLNNGDRTLLDLPANGVIYVNGTTGTTFNPRGTNRFQLDRGNVFVSGTLKGELTIGAAESIFVTGRDPTTSPYNNAPVTGGITYKDTDFVVNATTGDTTVTGTGTDMLGLVANNSIYALRYGWPTTNYTSGSVSQDVTATDGDLKVYGALFAMGHSIANESCYNVGSSNYSYDSAYPRPSAELIIRGSMIQNHRGIVAIQSGSTTRGYAKNYAHDPRMTFNTPPHFIEPVNSGWELNIWREVKLGGLAYLKSLSVSDGALSPVFNPNTNDYTVLLPFKSGIPVVSAEGEEESFVSITQPGTKTDTAYVEVVSEDGVSKNTYSIAFSVSQNGDDTLSSLLTGGTPVPGFSPDIYSYNVTLPAGSTAAPLVTATATEPSGATVQITQASGPSAAATVKVTADNGNTKTYTVQFKLADPIKLATVTNVSLSTGGVASWNSVSNSIGYRIKIYRGNTYITSVDVGSSPYNVLSILKENGVGSYNVSVTALGNGITHSDSDESNKSNPSRTISKLTTPDMRSWNSWAARWYDVENEVGYTIELYYRSDSSGEWTLKNSITVGSGTTSSNLTTQTADYGDYMYRVRANATVTSLNIDSDWSANSNIASRVKPKLSTPSMNGWSGWTARWSNVSNEDGYTIELEYRSDSSSSWSLKNSVTVGVNITSYDFTTQTADYGEYRYRVKADADATSSFADSDWSGYSTVSSRVKPKLNTPTVGSWNVWIARWNDIQNEDGYTIELEYRSSSYGTWSPEKTVTVGANTTTYNFSGDTSTVGYYRYRVKATALPSSAYADSDWSGNSGNQQKSKLGTPSINNWNGWTARWGNVPGGSGYTIELYYRSSILSSWTLRETVTAASNATSYNFDSLTRTRGNYRYRVKVNGSDTTLNGDSDWSGYSNSRSR